MTIPKRIIDNHNIAVKACRHGIFAYLVNDLFIGKSLDLYGEWTEPELTLLQNFIFPKSVVIDAGAFIGTHTVTFAKMAGYHGFVYAFEPQRIAYNLLCGNVSLNNLLNVKCFNAGLSDLPGKVHVPLLAPSSKQNFGGLNLMGFSEGDMVQITTVDNLNLKACNLIKADVEGMEANILKGGEKTIRKFKPVLYLENNRRETSEKTIKTVFDLGYKCYWHILNYFNPDNFFGHKKNIFKNYPPEANMLCLPTDLGINLPNNQGLIEVSGPDDYWEEALKRI